MSSFIEFISSRRNPVWIRCDEEDRGAIAQLTPAAARKMIGKAQDPDDWPMGGPLHPTLDPSSFDRPAARAGSWKRNGSPSARTLQTALRMSRKSDRACFFRGSTLVE
jgi:hypothetical protein